MTTTAVRLREFNHRWVLYKNGEKVGAGTLVATSRVMSEMARMYANEGQQFLYEVTR